MDLSVAEFRERITPLNIIWHGRIQSRRGRFIRVAPLRTERWTEKSLFEPDPKKHGIPSEEFSSSPRRFALTRDSRADHITDEDSGGGLGSFRPTSGRSF